MPWTATRSPDRAVEFLRRVIGRHSGAQQRSSFGRREQVGDSRECMLVGDHDFGVTAVAGNTGDRLILAIHEVAASAGLAVTAVAAEKSDADSLTDFPVRDALTEGIDLADDFMARNARELNTGSEPLDGEDV